MNLSVRIDCEIEKGAPPPEVTWYSGEKLITNSSKLEVYRNGSLLIKSVNQDLEGVYTCRAKTSGLRLDQVNSTLSMIGESL